MVGKAAEKAMQSYEVSPSELSRAISDGIPGCQCHSSLESRSSEHLQSGPTQMQPLAFTDSPISGTHSPSEIVQV